ncbi:MAG: hypothetical protein ABFS35_18835 [Bacteroidota bacterium]
MDIYQLNNNIRVGLTYRKLELEIFRWMKVKLVDILLQFQKDQLFMFSEGADGQDLGFYTHGKDKPSRRSAGEPFDMVFTGKLKSSLGVKVTTKYIEFTYNKAHVFQIQSKDVFLTNDWFGLSPRSMQILVDNYLKSQSAYLTKKKILTGKW